MVWFGFKRTNRKPNQVLHKTPFMMMSCVFPFDYLLKKNYLVHFLFFIIVLLE